MDLDNLLDLLRQPLQPVSYDIDNIPEFSKEDVDLYGSPSNYGYQQFLVIESPTYQQIAIDHHRIYKDKHRYSRIERFRSVLLQLVGVRGTIPPNVLVTILMNDYDKHPDRIFSSIRKILKANKMSKYVLRIQSIIHKLGHPYTIKVKASLQDMENQFRQASFEFERRKHLLNRKYFPNLKFWALKILQHNETEFGFKIPLLQTSRIRRKLNIIWNDFNKEKL